MTVAHSSNNIQYPLHVATFHNQRAIRVTANRLSEGGMLGRRGERVKRERSNAPSWNFESECNSPISFSNSDVSIPFDGRVVWFCTQNAPLLINSYSKFWCALIHRLSLPKLSSSPLGMSMHLGDKMSQTENMRKWSPGGSNCVQILAHIPIGPFHSCSFSDRFF